MPDSLKPAPAGILWRKKHNNSCPLFGLTPPRNRAELTHKQFVNTLIENSNGDKYMKFTLLYWKNDGWFIGKIKEVPGVISQGETIEELKENIEDAYKLMIKDTTAFPAHDVHTEEIRLSLA